DVDIEIVDDRLIRISGTGLYKSKINESVVTEGFIYDNVIQTGQYFKMIVLFWWLFIIYAMRVDYFKC
ncbi:hypothetical protein ACTPEF_23495, partial [Clostridioides difficile]